MGQNTRPVEWLFGYGWENLPESGLEQIANEIKRLHRNGVLTALEEKTALFVLTGNDRGENLSVWHRRQGLEVVRKNFSPDLLGVERKKLVLQGKSPYRTGKAAELLGLRPRQLRHLISRVEKGQVSGIPLPIRSIGRTASKKGWYMWSEDILKVWHEALIAGRFDAFTIPAN